MNATSRKIDSKADPASDPAMAAFRPANRMQSLMAEIRQDNPIAKPDRPHSPVAEVRPATSLDTQREELQRAVAPVAPEAEPAVAETSSAPVLELAASPAPAALVEPDATVKVTKEVSPPLSAPLEQTIQSPIPVQQNVEIPSEDAPVNDAAVHVDDHETKPRLRGRPRVGAEKKRESSFTLSPHMADRVRDLAAHEQLRLKRTVSASAIVERMLELAEQVIQGNRVLPS